MTNRSLFDVHCHLSSEKIPLEQRVLLVQQAREAGVEKMLVVATDSLALTGAFSLQERIGSDIIKVAAAMPPHDVTSSHDGFFHEIQHCLQKKKLVALGETGLEYFYCSETKHFQQDILKKYLDCSLEFHLPLIIHCRDGFCDLLSILSEYQLSGKNLWGMIHCFTGTLDEARRLLDLGWFLSFSGMLTYPKAKALQDVAQFVPLEKILIETDTPYLAPKQKRGQENRPEYLVYTAEFLSTLRSETYETIAQTTYANSCFLFDRETV